ncbi:MAG: putative D-lyxose ketol-isomerase [Lentisphaerae bacterium ADurb.BinA184]|nr:MAG: putative D-lyxose ketol-isomerase [Lentisphaerae bacterium ADurb.BinA184]
MKELSKGLDISLRGAVADEALRRFRRQLRAWRLTMPPAPPLVLDFGLGRFAETGLIEQWIANETAAGYCGKYLFVFDGQTCPRHRHGTKHETFFIVKGRVRMRHGGADRILGEGDVLPVAPGRYHSFTGLGPALLLEISMPCRIEDNWFADSAIPIGGHAGGGRSRTARRHAARASSE